MNKMVSYIYILIAASLWGCMGMCNRFLTSFGFSQSQILFVRCLLPALVLFVYLLLCHREAFRIKLKDLWCFLGSGLLSFTAFALAYNHAMQCMSLSLAVVLLYTAPIWVVLLSAVFFKERLSIQKALALLCIVIGALCTSGALNGSFELSPFGVLMGVISGLGYALYSIFSRFAFLRGYSSLTVTFYTFLFSLVATSFISEPCAIVPLMRGFDVLFWVLAISIGSTLLAYVFYTKGLEHVENSRASVLSTIELVVASLISVALFNEPFGLQNALGIVFVIAGIAVINMPTKQHEAASRSR